jgi:hypothetical protein
LYAGLFLLLTTFIFTDLALARLMTQPKVCTVVGFGEESIRLECISTKKNGWKEGYVFF